MKTLILSRSLVITACLFLTIATNAKTFYVNSRIGSDSNDGSSMSPWKTAAHLNDIIFKAGDKILFARGCRFSGSFQINNSGSDQRPIVIGAYGLGNKPAFSNPLSPDQTGDIIQVYGNHIIIRNLEFKKPLVSYANDTPLSSAPAQNKIVVRASVYQGLFANHLNITDCSFENCMVGINLKGQHNLVTRNSFARSNDGDTETNSGPAAAVLIGNSFNEISYNKAVNYNRKEPGAMHTPDWLLLDNLNSAAALDHLNVHDNQ